MKIVLNNLEMVEVRPKKKFYYLGETWAVVPYPRNGYTSNQVVHFETGVRIPLEARTETLKSLIGRAEQLLSDVLKRFGSEEFKKEINKNDKIN